MKKVNSLQDADGEMANNLADGTLVVNGISYRIPYGYFSEGQYSAEGGYYFNTLLFSSIDISNPGNITGSTLWSYVVMNLIAPSPFTPETLPEGSQKVWAEIHVNQRADGSGSNPGYVTRKDGMLVNVSKSGGRYTVTAINQTINVGDGDGTATISMKYTGTFPVFNTDGTRSGGTAWGAPAFVPSKKNSANNPFFRPFSPSFSTNGLSGY